MCTVRVKWQGVGKGGVREGDGEWEHAAQPGPYWLGREFPGWLVAGEVAGEVSEI